MSVDQPAVAAALRGAKKAVVFAAVMVWAWPLAALGRACDRVVKKSLAWAAR